MKKFILLAVIVMCISANVFAEPNKLPRVIVLTDAETDDRCSMVHFLLHSDQMQVDGIIQSNSCFQRKGWSSEPWLKQPILSADI